MVAAVAKLGLKCVLVQENWVDYSDAVYDRVGNIMMSRLMGADVRLVDQGFDIGFRRSWEEALEDVRRRGGKPYAIPAGASDHELGGLGYVGFAEEVRRQEAGLGFKFDYIVVCAVTGSTQAGMVVGFADDGRADRVIGIDASATPDQTRAQILRIARRTADMVGLGRAIEDADVTLDTRYALRPALGRDQRGHPPVRAAGGHDDGPGLRGQIHAGHGGQGPARRISRRLAGAVRSSRGAGDQRLQLSLPQRLSRAATARWAGLAATCAEQARRCNPCIHVYDRDGIRAMVSGPRPCPLTDPRHAPYASPTQRRDRRRRRQHAGRTVPGAPGIAARALDERPFATLAQLKQALRRAVDGAGGEVLAALIDAGASTLPKGDTSAERDQLARLAAAYRERHGHDPVLATHDARGRELDAGQAIASLARRLDHPADIERQETLIALHRNAELRLRDAFGDRPRWARISGTGMSN